jgi:hypothetical protein
MMEVVVIVEGDAAANDHHHGIATSVSLRNAQFLRTHEKSADERRGRRAP